MLALGVKALRRSAASSRLPFAAISAGHIITSRLLHADKGVRYGRFVKEGEIFLDPPPDKVKAPFKRPKEEKYVRRVASFKKRTEAYMLPFCLDVFMSKRYIHASIMHRVTSKVVAVACTNSKDLSSILKSRCDIKACRVVGEVLAERARDADVFTCIYIPRKNEKVEGKLFAVIDSVRDHGINLIM